MDKSNQMEISNTADLVYSGVPGVCIGIVVWFATASILVGLLLAVVILLITLILKIWVVIVIDRSNSKLKVSMRRLLGSSSCDYPLSSVTKIGFTRVYRGSGKGGSWVPIITFCTNQSGDLPFEKVVYDPEKAKKVAEFIGVPYEYDEPPSLGDVVHTIIDTISSSQDQPLDEKPEDKSQKTGN